MNDPTHSPVNGTDTPLGLPESCPWADQILLMLGRIEGKLDAFQRHMAVMDRKLESVSTQRQQKH
ncbi:hypothetical protein [Thiorhodococcus fuscus]|uniref:Uncharacterized protein n=1 Tax=Thiorhodococcus fuscus TaxID=527200 RepID=A0ABW4Y960_9GAMM